MRSTPVMACVAVLALTSPLGGCGNASKDKSAASAEPAAPASATAVKAPPATQPAKPPEPATASKTAATAPATAPATEQAPAGNPALLDPALATGQAPDEYAVKFKTTKGDFIIDVHREWAPLGADRFYNLVRVGYFDGVAFFRVVDGFMAQLGIHGDPRVNAVWRNQRIKDDPVKQSNQRGFVSFATSGVDSRVNQFFINYVDNSRLDPMGFAPFGKVRDMKTVDALYSGYGEAAPAGRGPSQQMMQMGGNVYLKQRFPELDYVETATVVE